MSTTTTAPALPEADPYGVVIGRILPQLRHPPLQARSLDTLRTILVTADAMISRNGPDRFTTDDLAAAAGVSIGTIYRYFDDRVDILDALSPQRHDAIARLHDLRLYLERTQAALAVTRLGEPPTPEDIVDHALDLLRGAAA
ncbi:helix-turn-helix domain-containing protein [Frigoribacterium sp. VKM Ac-2530]|uniref:helix-turn-helix domain-containing protein n=1 Tax=Frigoribacterium sp. VKM Ac-2530 TaxID=2783822 RepID=UPI00188C4074|nr:helix-turn-helix domain-containing protein [Frigoribacterium sp. VKM Ac-2530]MBF4578920.1 helix-turn-helix transcriptional regulator [Frigoribacterium sp. VKM Ac-2530]